MIVGFNPHSTDILFQFDEKFSSDGNPVTNEYFASEPKGTRGRDLDDFRIAGPRSSNSKKGFTLVTSRRNWKRFSRWLH